MVFKLGMMLIVAGTGFPGKTYLPNQDPSHYLVVHDKVLVQ